MWPFKKRRRYWRYTYFYLPRTQMIAACDGYALAGWEFVAWIDTEWWVRGDPGEEQRAALFRRIDK